MNTPSTPRGHHAALVAERRALGLKGRISLPTLLLALLAALSTASAISSLVALG